MLYLIFDSSHDNAYESILVRLKLSTLVTMWQNLDTTFLINLFSKKKSVAHPLSYFMDIYKNNQRLLYF